MTGTITVTGRVIQRELDARGWTQDDLAKEMVYPVDKVALIIQGETRITPGIARQLAAAFGTSAELWLNLDRVTK